MATPKIADPFFFAGIEAGFYTLPDLKERLPNGDPKVTLEDVCDVNEYLMVKAENDRRSYAASERQQQQQAKGIRKPS